jgi:hypothetical protein
LYGTGCPEAILTYVPQDVDNVVRAHMWIKGAQYCEGDHLQPTFRLVKGFPDSTLSCFPDIYTIVSYQRNSVLPPNQAIAACHGDQNFVEWLGDVLVIKHMGRNSLSYRSMGYEDKALVDAILSWYVPFWPPL